MCTTLLNPTNIEFSEIIEKKKHIVSFNICEIQEQPKLTDDDRSHGQGNSFLSQVGINLGRAP